VQSLTRDDDRDGETEKKKYLREILFHQARFNILIP
jgi:hypothetical protein